MRAQKVSMPSTLAESWTVLGEDLDPLEPAEDYLAYLTAVFGLHDYHARAGVQVPTELVAWRWIGRGYPQAILAPRGQGPADPTRPVKLSVPRRVPRTLSDEETVTLLAACEHLRDRFLVALLAETAMRIGPAPGAAPRRLREPTA